MKPSKEQIDRIETTLIAAHRRQEELQLPGEWRQQVMRDVQARDGAEAKSEVKHAAKAPWRILSWAGAGLSIILGGLIFASLDRYDPWITLKRDLGAPGPHPVFRLAAGDQDSGLRHLKVTVIQREIEIEVVSKDLRPPGGIWSTGGDAVRNVDFPLVLDPQALGIQQGKATIVVMARDLSWRDGFEGRTTILKKEVVIYRKESP